MKNIKISEEEARYWAMEEVQFLLKEKRELYKDAEICVVEDEEGGSDEIVFYAQTVEPTVFESYHIRMENSLEVNGDDYAEFLVSGNQEQEILYRYNLAEFINKYVLK